MSKSEYTLLGWKKGTKGKKQLPNNFSEVFEKTEYFKDINVNYTLSLKKKRGSLSEKSTET